jgi:hypothetical protein
MAGHYPGGAAVQQKPERILRSCNGVGVQLGGSHEVMGRNREGTADAAGWA